VSGQLHIPAAVPPGKEFPLPIDYEAGTASGAGLEVLEKNLSLTG